MSEELIYKVGVEGTNELNKLEQSVTKAGKSTGKTKLYMSELRTELRKARGDLIKYAEGTEEYNRALAKGARITQQINDANSKMRAGVQDLGATTKNVTSAMVGFAGGFQVVQSAMSLFGIENEETIKTILKLQQTMALVQGLSAFAQGIADVQDLIGGFRASSVQMNEELRNTSDSMEGVAGSSGKMGDSMGVTAKESAVLGSNLAGNTKVSDDLNKGLGEVNKSVTTMRELFEPGGFTDRNLMYSLEESLDAITFGEKDIKNLNVQTQAWIKFNTDASASIDDIADALEREIEVIGKSVDKHDELKKQKLKNTEATEGQTEATEKLGKASKNAGKGINSFASSIVKSLATMGAFLAIIALVTWGITELIKWMSKIPESVKVDIEIKETVSQQIGRDQIAVRKFVNDYKKAWRESDRERLSNMAKIAKEEYNMSEDRLKLITETEDGWRDAFAEYLDMAEKTYRAEAIIKMRVDNQLKADTEMFAAEEKFMAKTGGVRGEDGKADLSGTVRSGLEVLDWEKMKAIAEEGAISGKMWDIFDLWGVPQEIVDHLRAVNASNAIINNLPKINFDDLDFGTGKNKKINTGGGDIKTPVGKAPTLQDRKPDAVEDDLEVNYLQRRNALIRELTNEEIVIRDEALRKSDVLQSDSEVKYAQYQVRLAQARAKDLEKLQSDKASELNTLTLSYERELSVNNASLLLKQSAHNDELNNLRNFNQQKLDMELNYQKLLEDRQKLDAKKDKEKIEAIDAQLLAIKELYSANNDNIEQSKKVITAHKKEITAIQEKLKQLDNTPEEIARLKDELQQLNLAIADNSAFLVDSLARNTQAMWEQATLYVDAMAQTFNGLESMTADFMQAEDNKLAKEKNNLEASQAYREADSEQQQQMMYELEMANYEAKKKTFETNKAFQIGGVVATSAANQMDIIKAWLDPKTGGPLSPANIAVAAAATLANVTTTIGSIKQIADTSLEKPVPPMAGMGGGSSIGSIALSPNKTGLTSKEENLNMMYQSGRDSKVENVVRVSDINKTQNKVNVREKNSSY